MKKAMILAGLGLAVGPATLFTMSSCLPVYGQKAASATLPERAAILKGDAASRQFKQCSRPSPEAVSFWTPTASDVRAAEQSLPSFLQTATIQSPTGGTIKLSALNQQVSLYYRQYAGFVAKDGHKRLCVNAFAPLIKKEMEEHIPGRNKQRDWRRDPSVACDGGLGFWGAEYDTQTMRWSRFNFNGR